MIDHVWTLVCSQSVIDTESLNLSIHNVLEQINVSVEQTADLVIDLPHTIVSLWVRSETTAPARGTSRVCLVDPAGEKTAVSEMPVDLTKAESVRHRIIRRGLRIAGSGRHLIQVELLEDGQTEWRLVASVPLRVVVTTPEEN